MPRSFFDYRVGSLLIADRQGSELGGVDIASKEAAASLAELVRSTVGEIQVSQMAIEVRDEDGNALLKAALTLSG